LTPAIRSELVERTLKIAYGTAVAPLRRSRHASTYHLRLDGPAGGSPEAFVKLLDAQSGGLGAIRYLATPSPAAHLHGIAEALQAAGFAIAPLLMLGEEQSGGRTMLVTERIAGLPLPRFLLLSGRPLERKRKMLRALGAEIARLHRAGFLHGDLTPYNVFVANGLSERFVFIDHERTVRPRLMWQRRRLRNLVQLCRFDLEGMSRTDRIRIVDAYARGMGCESRQLVRRLTAMLRARRLRDAAPDDKIAAADGRFTETPGVSRSSGTGEDASDGRAAKDFGRDSRLQ
jgi:hypothetical protein